MLEIFKIMGSVVCDTDGANQSLTDVTGTAEKSSSKMANAFKKIGAAVATYFSAQKIVEFGKAVVDSYADYEQLVGGVDTLFKDSSAKVQQYATSAYEMLGLSANTYMEQVTSFSASLLQSLDGDTNAAAEKANLALTDMADNANKMGTSMESIQNAYQGFAKANYTMLDNLKLGYGGTKEEMERLLADAEKLSGIKYDVSSYSDIVDAIHVVQTEMGITGTTAEEASTTITGSLSATKAAWSNLLTGFADGNANLGVLLTAFASKVTQTASLIIPRVKQILLALPQAITSMLPTLLKSGAEMLLSLLHGFVNQIPALLTAIVELIAFLGEGFADNVDEIIQLGLDLVINLAAGIINNLPVIMQTAPQIIAKLVAGLIERIPDILAVGITLIVNLVSGITEASADLPQIGRELIQKILDALDSMKQSLYNRGAMVVNMIKSGISAQWNSLKTFFTNLWNSLFGNLNVNVNVNGQSSGSDGYLGNHAFATGLDFVPYDEFPATLHKGEMVLPAEQASVLRNGGSLGNSNNLNSEQVVSLLSDILSAVQSDRVTTLSIGEREFGRAVRSVV